MNWKYLVYDLLKVAVPIAAAQVLPDTAPQADLIQVVLYLAAGLLGVDALIKTTKVNLKYLVWDIFKVATPVIVAAFLPDTAPQAEVINSFLYGLAAVLGIDATAKTIKAKKNGG